MKIKVCGITQLKQLHQLKALNIAFAGLIFYKRSARCVIGKITPNEINSVAGINKIGAFVNTHAEEILKTTDEYSLDFVQLHGNESPQLCKQLSAHTRVIKVFRIQDTDTKIEELISAYHHVCDYFLFDTAPTNDSFGGTGRKFNWDIISNAEINKPFFLSGGIGIDDVSATKSFPNPDLYAVDINSRFETSPGIKDLKLIKEFSESINSK